MSTPEPQHRRPRRRRGVRLTAAAGRRRASGAVEQSPQTREDLSRQARVHQARRTRRKLIGAAVLAALIVWATVAVTSALRSSNDDVSDTRADPAPAQGVAVLVGVADASDRAGSIALVAAAEGHTPRLVLLPPSLFATLPGFGENTLSNAARFDGVELLEVSISNLLGIRIDGSILLDAAELAAVIGGPAEVDVPVPLFAVDGDAKVVAIAAGTAERTAEQIARLVVDRGGDDELEWIRRQGAAWEAILAAMDASPGVRERMVGTFDRGVAAARTAFTEAAADVVVTAVPATRIEPTGGEERYQLSGDVAAEFVAQSIPYLVLGTEPRVRIEVLNGNGVIGAARPVAATLIRRGYRVVRTDNADRLDYAVTRVIAHGREHQASALAVQQVLGRGNVSLELRQPSGVVDLTIIVGRDLTPEGG